jgi:hypothetical protein
MRTLEEYKARILKEPSILAIKIVRFMPEVECVLGTEKGLGG